MGKSNYAGAAKWIADHHLSMVSRYKWKLANFKGKSEDEIWDFIKNKILNKEAGKPDERIVASKKGQEKLAEGIIEKLKEEKPETADILQKALKVLDVVEDLRENPRNESLKRELWKLQEEVGAEEIQVLGDIEETEEVARKLVETAKEFERAGTPEQIEKTYSALREARKEFEEKAHSLGFSRRYIRETIFEIEQKAGKL